MKRFLLLLTLVGIALLIWLCFEKGSALNNQSLASNTNVQEKNNSQQPKTNLVAPSIISSNFANTLESVQTNIPPQQLLNAVTTTSLAQWQIALPNLKRLNPSDIEESWILEERNPNKYPSVLLTGNNGTNINFVASFVDVQAVKPDNHIRRIELQAPKMTIDEARTLGLQLCDLMELDSSQFLAWCDKVGNSWVDKPVFASKAGVSPDSNKTIGFTVNSTFNSEKPWYVTFILSDK